MTVFRLRPLDWKEVPDGFVCQTILGPISIRVSENDVTFETWFHDKPQTYEAVSPSHAKADARIKYLEALRPALEIVVDGPSEQTTEILPQPAGSVTNPAPVWDGNRH